jgi:hypothetical protein
MLKPLSVRRMGRWIYNESKGVNYMRGTTVHQMLLSADGERLLYSNSIEIKGITPTVLVRRCPCFKKI